jgi:hypoxanthine phosphoribosyltransferase
MQQPLYAHHERGTVEGLHSDLDCILFSEEQIQTRVSEMGAAITKDYQGKDLVVVSVLRGAAVFMADLIRQIQLPLEMDFVALSSYGKAAKSSGVVSVQKDLTNDITGRHVLIAEDIIDSGLTLHHFLNSLRSRKPASIKVAALLRKDLPGQPDLPCEYLGFACPDEFVVGYGLDYAERYRNLPYIGILKPGVIK